MKEKAKEKENALLKAMAPLEPLHGLQDRLLLLDAPAENSELPRQRPRKLGRDSRGLRFPTR